MTNHSTYIISPTPKAWSVGQMVSFKYATPKKSKIKLLSIYNIILLYR